MIMPVVQTHTNSSVKPVSYVNLLPQSSTAFPNRTNEALEAEAYNAQQAALAAEAEAQREYTAQVAQAAYMAPNCALWMAEAGITDPINAYKIIMFESGCRPDVMNAEGACGIPQALPCSKLPGYPNDPVAQLEWMQSYVVARYSTWAAAWQQELNYSWY